MFRAGQRISETSWPITRRTGICQVYHFHHFWAISNSHLTCISPRYLSHLVFGVQPSDLVRHYTTATEKRNRDISSKHTTKSLKMTPGFPHTRPGKLSQKTMEHHHAFFMDKSIIIPTFSRGHPPFPCFFFFSVETCHFGGCARSGGGSHALGRRGGVLIEIVFWGSIGMG